MQKAELLRAAVELQGFLAQMEVRSLVGTRHRVADWVRGFRDLSDPAVGLFEELGLSMLIDQSVLVGLGELRDDIPTRVASDRLERAVKFTQYLVRKLQPEVTEDHRMEVFRITFSSDPKGTQVDRLASMLTVTRDLYEVAREILAAEGDEDARQPHELRVVGIDSGSNFSFDALGLAKVAEVVKDFIFGIWDRIRTAKKERHQLQNDKILSNLALIARLDEDVAKGILSQEDAGRLKAKLMKQADSFITGGFHVDDDADDVLTIRQIASGQQRLLPASAGTGEPGEDDGLID